MYPSNPLIPFPLLFTFIFPVLIEVTKIMIFLSSNFLVILIIISPITTYGQSQEKKEVGLKKFFVFFDILSAFSWKLRFVMKYNWVFN